MSAPTVFGRRPRCCNSTNCATATDGSVAPTDGLDRLLHRATVINIKGDSYRMREKRQAGLFPGAVALEPATKGATATKTKPVRH